MAKIPSNLEFTFVVKGGKVFIRTMDKVSKEVKETAVDMDKLDKKTKAYINTSLLGVRNNRNMAGSFSVLRSKVLLLTFGIVSLQKTLGKYINVSADAEEIMNKFRVVFGRSSEDALGFANILGDKVGRSVIDLTEMMAGLQDTFVPLGFARDTSAELSKAVTKLAIDVASFQNRTDDEVVNAFTSAIVGNHEAVRSYGIVLTQAQLEQAALNSGIIDSKRELTAQEKVLARLLVIQNSTTDAVGDAVKTQDSYTNQLKRFNGELKDLQKSIGETLIPLANALLRVRTHFADTATLKGYAAGLGAIAILFVSIEAKAIAAAIATRKFRKALIRTGYGLIAVGIGEIVAQFIRYNDELKIATDNTGEHTKSVRELIRSIDEAKSSIRGLTFEQARGRLAVLNKEIAEQEHSVINMKLKYNELGLATQDWAKNLIKDEEEILASLENNKEALKAFIAELKNEKTEEFAKTAKKELSEIKSAAQIIFKENLDFQLSLIETQAERFKELGFNEVAITEWAEQAKTDIVIKHLEKRNALYSSFMAGYDTFVSSLTDMEMSGKERRERIWEATKAGFVKFLGEMLKEKIKKAIAEAIIDKAANAAQLTAVTAEAKMMAGLWSPAAFASVLATGATNVPAAIAAMSAGKTLATATMVGAEHGFDGVVNRPTVFLTGEKNKPEHVKVTPLTTDNRVSNRTSNVFNINISAPLVDETVVESIIPAIQRAERMNLA